MQCCGGGASPTCPMWYSMLLKNDLAGVQVCVMPVVAQVLCDLPKTEAVLVNNYSEVFKAYMATCGQSRAREAALYSRNLVDYQKSPW